MSGDTKPCKTCGKAFVPCVTHVAGAFNWRTVACSPECGQKYLYKIMVSRGLIVEEPVATDEETTETIETSDFE